METEAKIQELLSLAAPLRPLDDDDPAKAPLTGIIDEINRLRAEQANEPARAALATVEGADAKPAEAPKRRGGRPRKETQ